MNLRTLLLACLLNLATPVGSIAEIAVPPLLTLDADLTELELAQRAAPQEGNPPKKVEFNLPVHLGAPDVKIDRVSISQSGRILNKEAADTPLLTPDNGGNLHLAFDLSKFESAGIYQLILELSGHPQSVPTKFGEQAPPTVEMLQTIKFKLNKPAAELKVSTPLRMERVVKLPLDCSWCVTVEPSKITLNENGGKSWLNIHPTSWDVVLRKGEEIPEENRIKVELPAYVDGWGQADAKVELMGTVSIGTTSGVLTVRSPQLANKTIDFPITVVSRLCRIWVLVTIFAGIGVGWIFRDKLEAWRIRLEASLAAERERGKLNDLISKAVDEEVKTALMAILQSLSNVMDAAESLPEAINTAATEARTQREACINEADVKIKELGGKLDTWNLASGKTDSLPTEVETALAELRQHLDKQSTALSNRNINVVDDAVKRAIPEAARKVCCAIATWLDSLEVVMDTIKPWPETRLDKLVDPLKQDIKAYKDTLKPQTPVTPDAFRETLLDATDLWAKLHAKLFTESVDCVKAMAKGLSKALLNADATLKPQIEALDTARADLQKSIEEGGLASVGQLVDELNKVWQAVQEALAVICKTKSQKNLLEAGHFSEALKSVEIRPTETQLDESHGETESMPAALDQLANDQANIPERVFKLAPRTTWSIRLEAPTEADVFELVTVRARLAAAPGMDEPAVSLEWDVEKGVVATEGADMFEREFSFQRQGPSYIKVIATDSAGATRWKELRINIRRPQGEAAVHGLLERLAQVTRVQNLLSALIIGFVGWIMFSPSFIGTLPEFISAFLWGFTVDVGAAKVRELTDSAKALKPTLPFPKA
jgi:hypothetical protein